MLTRAFVCIKYLSCRELKGRHSVASTATRYGLDGPGSNAGGSEICHTRTHRPWGPPNLLYNGYWVSIRGVKRPGRGINRPPPCSCEFKERVELCMCSPTGPSWSFLRSTLLLEGRNTFPYDFILLSSWRLMLAYCTVKMQAVRFSERSVTIHHRTRRNIPEDLNSNSTADIWNLALLSFDVRDAIAKVIFVVVKMAGAFISLPQFSGPCFR